MAGIIQCPFHHIIHRYCLVAYGIWRQKFYILVVGHSQIGEQAELAVVEIQKVVCHFHVSIQHRQFELQYLTFCHSSKFMPLLCYFIQILTVFLVSHALLIHRLCRQHIEEQVHHLNPHILHSLKVCPLSLLIFQGLGLLLPFQTVESPQRLGVAQSNGATVVCSLVITVLVEFIQV